MRFSAGNSFVHHLPDHLLPDRPSQSRDGRISLLSTSGLSAIAAICIVSAVFSDVAVRYVDSSTATVAVLAGPNPAPGLRDARRVSAPATTPDPIVQSELATPGRSVVAASSTLQLSSIAPTATAQERRREDAAPTREPAFPRQVDPVLPTPAVPDALEMDVETVSPESVQPAVASGPPVVAAQMPRDETSRTNAALHPSRAGRYLSALPRPVVRAESTGRLGTPVAGRQDLTASRRKPVREPETTGSVMQRRPLVASGHFPSAVSRPAFGSPNGFTLPDALRPGPF